MASIISWNKLPQEIRDLLLGALLQNGSRLSVLATVSREWQTFIEPHNFGRLKLTPPCLTEFASKTSRNRHLVGYIWFCVELEEYNDPTDPENTEFLSQNNVDLVVTAISDLFENLSAWKPMPTDKLLLDISIYSPSDLEYRFQELTFRPDVPNKCDLHHCLDGLILTMFNNQTGERIHGQDSRLFPGIKGTFGLIGSDECLFEDKESESQWWQQLPLVPAVTGILLRQQTRRQWSPFTLAQMFTRLPRLQEIHYEPWMDWIPSDPLFTDEGNHSLSNYNVVVLSLSNSSVRISDFKALFDSIASKDLKKLTIFENFHSGTLPAKAAPESTRTLVRAVSRMTAKTSLKLEDFSGSFLVDATHFFASCNKSWQWKHMRSLTVTSQILTANGDQYAIADMLRAAAAAVMNMPQLKTIEIWNGQSKSATLFRYQPNRGQTNAVLTWRSTWAMVIQPSIIEDWTAVAYKHGARGLQVHKEILDVRDEVKFHGDAVHCLQLSQSVTRPVSLEQIRQEQEIHDNWKEWQKDWRKEFVNRMEQKADPNDRGAQEIMAYLQNWYREAAGDGID